ncbi:unnamed protein product [Ostreobium quekettii]|uniref:Uncharacterized protein n=1 Tax=Ostreobium quekettii TaxID=121088 RepID=A0A8S1IN91_9CHLO|nr:unnamed protein product [Ostreobium quekettii]
MAAAARGNKDEPRLLGLLFASSGEADMTLGTEVQVSGSGDTPTAETPPGSIAGHGGMRQFSGLADGGDDEAGGRRRSREEAVREALGRDDGLLMRALARDRAGGAVGREGAGAADRGAGARGEGGKEGMTLGCLALRLPGAEDPEPKAGERRRSVEVCSPPPRAPRAGGGRGRFLEGELGDPEPDGDSNSSDGEFDRAPDSGLVLSRPNAKAGGGGVWALFGGPAGREGAAGVGREDEKDDGKSAKLFYSPPAGPREAKSKPAQRRRRAARPAAPKGPIAIPAPVAIAGPREGLCPPGADGGVAGSAEGGVYVVVNGRGESGMDGGIGEDEEAAGSAPLGPGSRTWGAELGRVAVGTAAVAWEAAPSSGGKVDGGLHDAEYDPIKKTSSRTGSPSHRPEPPPLSNNPFRRAGLIPPDPGPLPRADALDSPDCLDDPVMLTPRDTVHHAAIMNRLSTSTPTPSVASSAENNPIGREPDRYANPLGASPLRIAAGLEEDWTPMSDPIMAVRGRGDAAVAPIAWPQAAGDAIEDPGTDPNRNSAGMIDEDGGINRRHALSTFRADVVVPETRSSWDSGGAWDPPRDAESASGSRHAVYSFAFVAAPGVPTQEAALRDSSTPIGGRDREAVIDGGGEGEDAGPGGGEGSPSPEGGVAWGPAGRPAEEAAASGPADTPNLSMCERRLLVPGSPSWESDDRPEYHPSAAPIGLYGGANRGRASFGVPGDRRDSVNRRARHRRTSCELETNPNLKMKECVGLLEQRRASGAVSRAVGGVRQRSLRALRRLCWRA